MSLSLQATSLDALLNSSRWSRGDVESFQGRRLQALVRHAFERVPFYRDLLQRHGVEPGGIRGLGDLARLPFALRQEMQNRPSTDLVAAGYKQERLIVHRTSGSTGAPFTIRRTWFEERLLNAFRRRELRRLGLRLTDAHVTTYVGGGASAKRRFSTHFSGLLPLRGRLDCLAPARELLDRLAGLQPDVVTGFAGTLAWLASEATAADRERIRPRFIVTGAETLTPPMRRQIGESFGAPVYDFYGAHEFNLLARQCSETGLYHVIESNMILEILDDGRPVAPGETGEVYGTALHSFAMPFLRYRLGDLVTRGPERCPCGAPCSTIRSIEGRTADRFAMPDGSTLHPYHLVIPLTHGAPWVRRYQIIQEAADRILVKVVAMPGCEPDEDRWAQMRAQIAAALPASVALTLERVAELPPSASGKFRPYYSLVEGAGVHPATD